MKKSKEMDLRSLLVQKIDALFDIENQLVKALPKMAKAASDEDLKEGFKNHLEETKVHVHRLNEIYKLLGAKPKKLKVEAIRGLVDDGAWVIKNVKPKESRDAALVRAGQYVEHYEMAGYMGAIAWAGTLGETEVAALLTETLAEEENANNTLEEAGEKIDSMVA